MSPHMDSCHCTRTASATAKIANVLPVLYR